MKAVFARRSRFIPDFAAKVRWRMKFDRNPLFVTVQDKYALRDYAESRGLATARLFYATEDPDAIDLGSLPADCMIKANHASAWNMVRLRGQFYIYGYGTGIALCGGSSVQQAASALSEAEVRENLRHWMHSTYDHGQWAYGQMKPRILVEEILAPRQGDELMDYRLYTFDGVVRAINVGSPSYRRDCLNAFFHPDWTLVGLTRYREKLPDPLPEKPRSLDEMIEAAARLGRGLDFVRIGFYETSRGVVLGEMTIYPEGGDPEAPSGCPRFNRMLGRAWKMSCHKSWSVQSYTLASVARSAWNRGKRLIAA